LSVFLLVHRLEIETEKLLSFSTQPVAVLCPLAGSCEYVDEPPFIIIIIIKSISANYNHCHGDLS
jgi:hypothetical protein